MANFGTDTDILHESIMSAKGKPSDRLSAEQPKIENSTDHDTNGDRLNGSTAEDTIKTNAKTTNGPSKSTAHNRVRQFLCDNQLGELYELMIDSGYDDIDFVKGILEETDLDTLGVRIELRQRLMGAIDSDLQKPARAISTVTKTLISAFDNTAISSPIVDVKSGTSADHTANTNNNHNNHINNNSNANDNGNYSSATTSDNQDQSNSNEMPSVDEWLKNIRLPQYGEVFRYISMGHSFRLLTHG